MEDLNVMIKQVNRTILCGTLYATMVDCFRGYKGTSYYSRVEPENRKGTSVNWATYF